VHQGDPLATAATIAKFDQKIGIALPPVARIDGGVTRGVTQVLHRLNSLVTQVAAGRPKTPWHLSGDVQNSLFAGQDLAAHLFLIQIPLASVAIGVIGDLVTVGHDLAGQSGELAHVDTDHEKGCLHFVVLENVQQQRRVERIGSVVEG